MCQLKEKSQDYKSNGKYYDLISLLTLTPDSWSREKVAQYFEVLIHLVRRAKILKSEKGVFAKPNKKHGRALKNDEIDIIQDFYRSDENSRETAKMRQCVSVPSSMTPSDRERHRKLPSSPASPCEQQIETPRPGTSRFLPTSSSSQGVETPRPGPSPISSFFF